MFVFIIINGILDGAMDERRLVFVLFFLGWGKLFWLEFIEIWIEVFFLCVYVCVYVCVVTCIYEGEG